METPTPYLTDQSPLPHINWSDYAGKWVALDPDCHLITSADTLEILSRELARHPDQYVLIVIKVRDNA